MEEVKIIRRNRRGTKRKDLFAWENEPLEDMDSTFAVQQHLQTLISTSLDNVEEILTLPENQDSSVWQYEQLRQFTLELNHLTVWLLPACNQETCPMMIATEEWSYLCASHQPPKECSAIDYIIHTMDSTTLLLNSLKSFPSRFSIPPESVKHFQPCARRLYRIFAHAYFHHPDVFNEFEKERKLLERFVKFCRMFELVQEQLFIIPLSFQ
eukprot:Lithocolla_globosa_v1_NODE_3910_length_1552_cov_15.615230.p1 type:complete len:211 gc:universal NODE_3910_length_1552_cov_15.615230:808-1440(+)